MTLGEVIGTWGVVPARVRVIKRSGTNTHWSVHAGGLRYVLRSTGPHRDLSQVLWEHDLLAVLAARGWPVACAIGAPVTVDGAVYSLFPFMGGSTMRGLDDDQRRRCGRVLAEFHLAVADLSLDGRPGSSKIVDFDAESLLQHDNTLRAVLDATAAALFVDRARAVARAFQRFGVSDFHRSITHRDLSPWNLRFRNGRLAALYDLDSADLDPCAADVACGRRGYHNTFVDGYLEVLALSHEELAALDAHMLGYAAELITEGLTVGKWNESELQWCRAQLVKTVPFILA